MEHRIGCWRLGRKYILSDHFLSESRSVASVFHALAEKHESNEFTKISNECLKAVKQNLSGVEVGAYYL